MSPDKNSLIGCVLNNFRDRVAWSKSEIATSLRALIIRTHACVPYARRSNRDHHVMSTKNLSFITTAPYALRREPEEEEI